MAISKFKEACLREVERVRQSGEILVLTKFGKPVAEVSPPQTQRRRTWLGCMEGTVAHRDDLVAPLPGRKP